MPKKVESWDRRRSESYSLSDYHRWVIKNVAAQERRRDKAQALCLIIEDEGERRGLTLRLFLDELAKEE